MENLNRIQRRRLIKDLKKGRLELNGVQKNNKGGWDVKTTLPREEFEVFRKKGRGLYAWVTESQFNLMSSKLNKIKFGQFGTNSENGTTPQETILSYTWINEPIVILWVYHFGEEEMKIGTPYEIEQKVKKTIGTVEKDGAGRETYLTSIDIIAEEVGKALGNENRPWCFSPRESQYDYIEKYVKHRLNGGQVFLLGAIMRYGKNFAWLMAMYKLYKKGKLKKGDVLCALTSKPGTFHALKELLEKHILLKDFNYILLKSIKDLDSLTLNPNKINVIAVSTQLVYNPKRKNTLNKIKEFYFKDIFIDECHSGTNTEKFNKLIDQLSYEHLTFVSGTPYKTIASRGFNSDNSFMYGYVEQMKDKVKDIKNGLENDSVQIKTYIMEVLEKFKKNPNYIKDENFTMDKLFSINEDDGTFIYGNDVYEFLENILGKSNNKSKFSPFRICSEVLSHTLWLCPGNSIDVVKAIRDVINKIAPEIHVIVASGDETKDVIDVHKAIVSYDKTITLTIGRFIEGVTVEEWNGCLVLSETESLEKYLQFIFRVTSPKKGKHYGYVFDFSLERALKMIFEVSNEQANNENRDDSQQVIKEWLDCNNVYRMGDGPQPKLVDVNDILEQINKGDYRAAILTKTYNEWIDVNKIDNNIISKFSDLKTYQKQVIKTEINTNDIGGGKNYTQTGVKKEMTKREKDKFIMVIKNIVGIVAPLPLLASVYEQKTIQDILNNVSDESFEEVCKIDKSMFNLLINMGIIKPRKINYHL